MVANLLLIAATGIGVDVGWRATSDGRIEYIIQVTPEELQDLDLGDVIAASDVPAGLPPIASYRIVVGRSVLPRELPKQPENPGHGTTDEKPPGPPHVDNPGYDAQPAIAVFPTEPKQLPGSSADVGPMNDPAENTGKLAAGTLSSQQNDGAIPTQSPETASPSSDSEKTPGQWQPIWLIITCLIVVCLAVTVFTAWAVADYRRKYRQLLAKLAVESDPSEPSAHSHTDSQNNTDRVPQPQSPV